MSVDAASCGDCGWGRLPRRPAPLYRLPTATTVVIALDRVAGGIKLVVMGLAIVTSVTSTAFRQDRCDRLDGSDRNTLIGGGAKDLEQPDSLCQRVDLVDHPSAVAVADAIADVRPDPVGGIRGGDAVDRNPTGLPYLDLVHTIDIR